ncbi:large ribosomal subunit protein mL62 [Halyomorpha halys]|uniref:large ribosomal subunit protein mL62 n=1 Tax=Halyomorpha halys TaxID=286706 RepID=UPI0006D4F8E0|nr:peptidyl-tRNA hydrolase ICT1, mitochondrial [Halyomorpha halys]
MQFHNPIVNLFRNHMKTSIHKISSISTFESSISLKKLFPSSSLSLTAPVKPPENPNLKFNGFIPIDKLNISYCRSSGPGGQNVNKVNTKVDIRFNLESAEWIDDEVKKKLADLYNSRLNRDGYFIVRSDKTRSQFYNQADAITVLREMLFNAAKACIVQEPSQETLHILRKRKERANIQRLAAKSQHSLKKQGRKTPNY